MIKKVLLALATTMLAASTSVFATAKNGLYLGLQMGESKANYSDNSSGLNSFFSQPTLPNASIDENSFAGRLYMGYQWNKFIAAELGYNYLGNVQFNNIFGISGADADLRQQAADLSAKVMLPITKQFNVFALGGGAYVWAKAWNTSTTADTMGVEVGSSQGTFTPVYGLGADYDFNEHWGVDVSWRRFIANGDLEQTDLAMAGVAVHF
ncbi:MAG: outer membrane beta-barrel protein [Gammaproteobacteria bacterium]|nr:outer membrane beta-barrel protein [Gammaproteobacteria bacterium]